MIGCEELMSELTPLKTQKSFKMIFRFFKVIFTRFYDDTIFAIIFKTLNILL